MYSPAFTVRRRSHVLNVGYVLDHFDNEDEARAAVLNCEEWFGSELNVRNDMDRVIFSAEWDEDLQRYVEE